MESLLASWLNDNFWIFKGYHLLMFPVLIALIAFWVIYRRRQM